jgi:enoyl-CoA hydratase/carnithine racemase
MVAAPPGHHLMAIHHLTLGDLLRPPGAHDPASDGDLVLVDLDAAPLPGEPVAPLSPATSGIVIGLTDEGPPHLHPAAAACDVVVPHGHPAVEQVAATVAVTPLAARAFAVLMRATPAVTVDEGLAAESAVYSTLQAGPEFAAWRAARPIPQRNPEDDPIGLERDGGTLHITLTRPHVGNALSTAMRDALVDAFALPALDPSITAVHLWGAGGSFCTGGDLDEFGSFPDPATAHLLRLQQSVGRAIAVVAPRVTAHLHGACVGSGIELPAFAGRVIAEPGTRIALPELALGLIPGAGGTVSLPRRIGRLRATRLGLTGESLDAVTALDWGLVDELASLGSDP